MKVLTSSITILAFAFANFMPTNVEASPSNETVEAISFERSIEQTGISKIAIDLMLNTSIDNEHYYFWHLFRYSDGWSAMCYNLRTEKEVKLFLKALFKYGDIIIVNSAKAERLINNVMKQREKVALREADAGPIEWVMAMKQSDENVELLGLKEVKLYAPSACIYKGVKCEVLCTAKQYKAECNGK